MIYKTILFVCCCCCCKCCKGKKNVQPDQTNFHFIFKFLIQVQMSQAQNVFPSLKARTDRRNFVNDGGFCENKLRFFPSHCTFNSQASEIQGTKTEQYVHLKLNDPERWRVHKLVEAEHFLVKIRAFSQRFSLVFSKEKFMKIS